jgi:hypothetical protein
MAVAVPVNRSFSASGQQRFMNLPFTEVCPTFNLMLFRCKLQP